MITGSHHRTDMFTFLWSAVARQRFVRPDFINRALGLPTYYLGQLLLALTVGAS